MKPLSRRALLRGAAGAAVALPLLDAMVPLRGFSSARGQAVKPPKRILFFLTPGGFHMDAWKCAVAAGGESRTVALSPILSAFSAIRNECLFIEGVPLTSAEDPRTCAAGHPQGTSAVFTGAFAGPGTMYGGNTTCTVGPPEFESIDQTLARAVGAATRFPSLHVGSMVQGNVVAKRVFYAKGQTLISPQSDPAKVFQTLFGTFTPPGSTAQTQLEERRYLLGSVMAEYKALRCQVGSEDRQRLDRHVDELQGLSTRLGLTGGGSACKKPTAPTGINATAFDQMPQVNRAMMDLVAMAFACDLTRVVGFQMHAPDMDSNGIYSWLGHDTIWHLITHQMGTDPLQRIQDTNLWQAAQLLYLVQKLKGLQEADGSSVMDNTVIVWTSEIGRGWTHDPRDVAWHLIGKGQGYFDTGKYIRFSGNPTTRHNRLLLHLLHYFGVEAAGFGHPDYQGSALPGIAA